MTQREEFEAWFISTGHEKTALNRHKFYVEVMVEEMWKAWKAAKAQAVPEGWKLVPIDPTQEMFDAAFHAPSVGHPETSGQSYGSIYKVMVSAAPEQQK